MSAMQVPPFKHGLLSQEVLVWRTKETKYILNYFEKLPQYGCMEVDLHVLENLLETSRQFTMHDTDCVQRSKTSAWNLG